MYHHHVIQSSRQHHPSHAEMHDFLSGDPMSAALAAASDHPSHHSSSGGGTGGGGGGLHPSSLYGSAHSHHGSLANVNGMNTKDENGSSTSVHAAVSYEPFLVNGMTLSGLHHHA